MQPVDLEEISFDGWTLNKVTGELKREGRTQRLPQQQLRILLELIAIPGQPVTREQLRHALWPQGVVDFDNGLNVAVRKLRTALGDVSDTPRYIETLPRIGYRFLAPIDVQSSAAAVHEQQLPEVAARQPRRGLHLALLVVVLVLGAVAIIWLSQRDLPLPVQDAPISTAKRTVSERAYELYLDGMFQRSRRDIDGTGPAIASFQAALREDPYFSDAWAGLGETLSGAAIRHFRPTVEILNEAKSAALRAVELDPDSAPAHTVLGHVYMQYDRDYESAEKEFNRARALNDRYARLWHHLAILRAYQGRLEEALAAMRRARELEPMTLLYSANYGQLLYQSRRFDEAVTHVRTLLNSQPRLDQARSTLIRALVEQGKFAEALDQTRLKSWEAPSLSDVGLVHARAGRRSAALQEIERIERHGREGFGVAYEVAVIYAAVGDKAAACDSLDRAFSDHSPTLGWMVTDPRLDPIRNESCYGSALARLKKTSLR